MPESHMKQRVAADARRSTFVLLSLAVLSLTVPITASAQHAAGPQPHGYSLHTKRARLDMVERSSRLIELPDSVTHVLDFDQQVLSVEAVTDRQVRVTVVGPGVTTIVFLDVNGVSRELEIFVTGDTRYLSASLNQLFPGSNIEAVQIGETGEAVVLRGWVTDPAHVPEIIDVAREFYPEIKNQLRTATNERVLLEVKIMEVNRSKLREFGFDFFNFGSTVRLGSVPGAFNPLALDNMSGGLTLLEQTVSTPNLGLQVLKPGYQFFSFLQALQTDSLAKILAEPKLVTTSGRPATLLSGGEFPILVPQGVGNTSIEFRSFGVKLEAVPIVLGNNRLRLEIAPEVSERDFSSAVTLQGVQVPGLTTRRINTGAELSFGETLMLGGLVSTRDVGSTRKVPFLGELPYIGMAFSRKSYSRSETELLIMVTPYPAAPLPPGTAPVGPGLNTTFPTDKELYIDGLLELPNYGDPCSDTNVNCGPPMLMHGVGDCSTGNCGTACATGTCAPAAYPMGMSEPPMMTQPVMASPSMPATYGGQSFGGPVVQSSTIAPAIAPTPADAMYNPPAGTQMIDSLNPIEQPMQAPASPMDGSMQFNGTPFNGPGAGVPAVPANNSQTSNRRRPLRNLIQQTSAQETILRPRFTQPTFETPQFQTAGPSAASAGSALPAVQPKQRGLRGRLQGLKSSY